MSVINFYTAEANAANTCKYVLKFQPLFNAAIQSAFFLVCVFFGCFCFALQYNMPESKANKRLILQVCRSMSLLIGQSVDNIDESPHSCEERDLQKEVKQTHDSILSCSIE